MARACPDDDTRRARYRDASCHAQEEAGRSREKVLSPVPSSAVDDCALTHLLHALYDVVNLAA